MSERAALHFGPHLQVAARSIIGARPKEMRENQDNYLLIDMTGRAVHLKNQREYATQAPHWVPGHVRLAVMDGVGGHQQGREAAEAVAEALVDLPPLQDLGTLEAELLALHRRLQARWPDKVQRPGTTVLLLEIPPQGPALLFHVGDSRLYAVNDEEAECLTVDQVPPTLHAMQGLIGEADWRRQVHAEDRSQISQAFVLGSTLATPGQLDDDLFALSAERLPSFLAHLPDRRTLQFDRECIYLLATDGLWALADPLAFVRRWPDILHQPKLRLDYALDDLFTELILASAEEPSIDNATAIALRIAPLATETQA